MRSQTTAYLQTETKKWLRKYVKTVRLKESEIVKCLIERERRRRSLEQDLQQNEIEIICPPKKQLRSQMTVYLHSETKKWLKSYADGISLRESEIVRCLIEREKRKPWLEPILQN